MSVLISLHHRISFWNNFGKIFSRILILSLSKLSPEALLVQIIKWLILLSLELLNIVSIILHVVWYCTSKIFWKILVKISSNIERLVGTEIWEVNVASIFAGIKHWMCLSVVWFIRFMKAIRIFTIYLLENWIVFTYWKWYYCLYVI